MTGPTPEQEAICARGLHENLYVRACPGSGKTRTVVELGIKAAAAGGPRQGVAFLSFTNAACGEVTHRLVALQAHRLLRSPSYVGTFDAFLIRFVLGPNGLHGARVQFREDWDGQGFQFTRGSDTTIFVPFDAFVPDGDGGLALHPRRVASIPLRRSLESFTETETSALLERARARMRGLLRSGLATAPFVRSAALRTLRVTKAACAHIATRFPLVIVDEAQDCDPTDLAIVRALAAAGCRCVIVADPEQAIYRWRDADPARLEELGFAELGLTGNFRSTGVICKAAASLRISDAPPDAPCGAYALSTTPVLVIPYADDEAARRRAGIRFDETLTALGIARADAVALGHRQEHASALLGITDDGDKSRSVAAVLSRAAVGSHVNSAYRSAGLKCIDNALAKALDVDMREPRLERWRMMTARQVLGEITVSAPSPSKIVKATRDVLAKVGPPIGFSFSLPPMACLGGKDRSDMAPKAAGTRLAFSTVHAVKGRQFEAVLVALGDDRRLEELLTAWENRDGQYEGRAVIYVAATRARQFLAFAVPARVTSRVAALLGRHGAAVTIVSVPDPPVAKSGRKPRQRGSTSRASVANASDDRT